MAETVSRTTVRQAQRTPESTQNNSIEPPRPVGAQIVDESVKKSLPIPGTKILQAQDYGESLWGKTARIRVELASGERQNYFLKVMTLGRTGRHMCEGEFESLKAIHAVSPNFVPKPYAWGKYLQEKQETYFLLTEFRDVGEQVSLIYNAHLWSARREAEAFCGVVKFEY